MVEKKPIVTDTKAPLTENVEKRFIDTIPCTYILSVLSATAAEFVTYPLDLTKTRLQIQGELAKTQEVKVNLLYNYNVLSVIHVTLIMLA